MPMEDANVSLPFAQGIDAKTDPKQMSSGKLLGLKNGVFRKGGIIEKRKGFRSLGTSVSQTTPADLGSPTVLAAHEDELIAQDNGNFFSKGETSGDWTIGSEYYEAPLITSSISERPVTASLSSTASSRRIGLDGAYNNGLECYLWGTLAGSIRVTVRDSVTGAYHMISETVSGAETGLVRTRVIPHNDGFLLVYEREFLILRLLYTTEIKGTTPSVLETEVAQTISPLTGIWDVHTNTVVTVDGKTKRMNPIAAYIDSTNDLYFAQFDETGTLITSSATAMSIGTEASVAVAYHPDVAVVSAMVYGSTTSEIYTRNVDGTLSSASSSTGITISGTMIHSGGCYSPADKSRSGEDDCFMFVSSVAGSPIKDSVTEFTSVGTTGSYTQEDHELWTGAIIASKPFSYLNKTYVTVRNLSDEQAAYYIVTEAQHAPVARFAVGVGPTQTVYDESATEYQILSSVTQVDGLSKIPSKFFFSLPTIEATLETTTDEINSSRAVEFDFNGKAPSYAFFAEATVFAGPVALHYDGTRLTELGFLNYPENIDLTTAASGGALSDGTYSVVVLYSYYDSGTRRYVSGVSTPVSITLSGGGSAQTIVADVPRVNFTHKQGYFIEIYATEAAGTTHYLQAVSAQNQGDSGDDTTTISAAIQTDTRIVYTDGGVLSNSAPPPSAAVTVRRDRLFMAASDGNVFFTNKEVSSLGAEFSDTLFIAPNKNRGGLTNIATQDGKVVVFSERGIQYFDGDGPNTLGIGAFTKPRDIISSTGALPGKPLATASKGTFYISSRGVELLDRSLSNLFIGSPVQGVLGEDVHSILWSQTDDEVLFFDRKGQTAVYNYFFDQWSTFDLNTASAVMWQDNVTILTPEGKVLTRSDIYCDESGSYSLVIDTPWVKATDIQGWQRIRDISLIGDSITKHRFKVTIYHDYNEVGTQVRTLDVKAGVTPHQFQFKPSRQKCQSIRFRIEDTELNGTEQSYKLSHMQLRVRPKRGLGKLSPALKR